MAEDDKSQDQTEDQDKRETEEEEVDRDDSQDETEAQDPDEEETSDDDVEEEESDPDDSETEDEIEEGSEGEQTPEFQKRFTQFQGETPEEYIKNLEEGHANSISEAQRLAEENKRLRAQAQPQETDKETPAQTATSDPMASAYIAKQIEADFQEFAEKHSEINDQAVQNEILDHLTVYADAYEKQHGIRPTMKQGLEKAWVMSGRPLESKPKKVDKEQQRKEEVLVAAKQQASTSKVNSKKSRPKSGGKAYSQRTLDTARAMDPDLRGKSDAEVTTALAKAEKETAPSNL